MPQATARRRVKVRPRREPKEVACTATCRLCGEMAGADDETKLLAWFPQHLGTKHQQEFADIMKPVGNLGTMLFCRHFDTEPDWKQGPDVEQMKQVVLGALEG